MPPGDRGAGQSSSEKGELRQRAASPALGGGPAVAPAEPGSENRRAWTPGGVFLGLISGGSGPSLSHHRCLHWPSSDEPSPGSPRTRTPSLIPVPR